MVDLYVVRGCLVRCDADVMIGSFADTIADGKRKRGKRVPRSFTAKRTASVAVERTVADFTGMGVPLNVVRAVCAWTRRHEYRIELLATWLLIGGTFADVLRYHRDLETNPVGFSGRSNGHKCAIGCDGDCRLAGVVVREDSTAEQAEAERLVSLVVGLLGTLGESLANGLSVEDAATVADVSLRTAYRRIEECRQLLVGT